MLLWTPVSHSAGELCSVSVTDDIWKACNMMKVIVDSTKLVCLLANMEHSSLCVCFLERSRRHRRLRYSPQHPRTRFEKQPVVRMEREQHVNRANWCSILWFKRWPPDRSSPSLCGEAAILCALILLCLQIQKPQIRIGSGLYSSCFQLECQHKKIIFLCA